MFYSWVLSLRREGVHRNSNWMWEIYISNYILFYTHTFFSAFLHFFHSFIESDVVVERRSCMVCAAVVAGWSAIKLSGRMEIICSWICRCTCWLFAERENENEVENWRFFTLDDNSSSAHEESRTRSVWWMEKWKFYSLGNYLRHDCFNRRGKLRLCAEASTHTWDMMRRMIWHFSNSVVLRLSVKTWKCV